MTSVHSATIRAASHAASTLTLLACAAGALARPTTVTATFRLVNVVYHTTSSDVGASVPDQTGNGLFTWTYAPGNFAGGTGQIVSLDLPFTPYRWFDPLGLDGISGVAPANIDNVSYDFAINYAQPLTGPTSSTTIASGSYDFTGTWYYSPGAGFNGEFIGTVTGGRVVPVLCDGDLNNDHTVNSLDLGVLLAHFGQSVTPHTSGDINGDGLVNSTDLGTLLSNFGNTCN